MLSESDPYLAARVAMVEEQLAGRGIRDPQVLEAMRKVPRHAFLGPGAAWQAYEDCALPSAEGQTISQPYMVAVMTERLEVKPGQRILEVGTGTGYQTAILAELVGVEGRVYTIEMYEGLSEGAQVRLGAMGYRNVEFRVGDGTWGWPEAAPFDGILVTAGAPEREPPPLLDQLKVGGVLVIPLGSQAWQELYVVRRGQDAAGATFERRNVLSCRFVPLVGRYGWKGGE